MLYKVILTNRKSFYKIRYNWRTILISDDCKREERASMGHFLQDNKICPSNARIHVLCFSCDLLDSTWAPWHWIFFTYLQILVSNFNKYNIKCIYTTYEIYRINLSKLKNTFFIILFSLPWDQHTLIGYIGEVVFTIIFGGAFFICNGAYLIFFISICWHLKALSKMFQHSAQKLNEPNDDRDDEEYICGLIQFQNEINGFVKHWTIFLHFKTFALKTHWAQ